MSDFYSDLGKMASELLSPTSSGGLGQGTILLNRLVKISEPTNPWDPAEEAVVSEKLKGVASGVRSNLVGLEVGGTVVLASDLQVTASVPSIPYEAGDTLSIDGKSYHVISVQNVPAAGKPVIVKFIVRG